MQPVETHNTTKDITQEELRGFHVNSKNNQQNRKVNEELIQRAWHTAHLIAAMLYEEFGATKVAIFGSLAEQGWFSKWSDIDVAVWGIPNENYLRASSKASNISGLFKVDLVDFESSNGLIRERIQNQLISIEKGVIYKVDRKSLIVRITDERKQIEETITKVTERLAKIKVAPVEYREEVETTIAKDLVDCYRGMENIFKRIAIDVDLHMPDGSRWHKELLTQMAEEQDKRPPVISDETYERLQDLLEFRHVFYNIYGRQLMYEKTEQNALNIGMIFDRFSKELDTFIAHLKKEEND